MLHGGPLRLNTPHSRAVYSTRIKALVFNGLAISGLHQSRIIRASVDFRWCPTTKASRPRTQGPKKVFPSKTNEPRQEPSRASLPNLYAPTTVLPLSRAVHRPQSDVPSSITICLHTGSLARDRGPITAARQQPQEAQGPVTLRPRSSRRRRCGRRHRPPTSASSAALQGLLPDRIRSHPRPR